MNRLINILFLLVAFSVHAEIHVWTDENGKKHFTDKPPMDIETSIVEVKVNSYESPNIESYSGALASKDKVVMYSATWCGYCKKAKKYFNSNNISFSEYDVESSSKGKRDYKRMKGRGVPIILIGDNRMNGFSQSKFESIYKK